MRVSSLLGREPEGAQGVEAGGKGGGRLQGKAVKSLWASETRLQQAEVTDKSRGIPPPAPSDFQGYIEDSERAHCAPAVTRKRLSSATPATNKVWTPGH